MSLLAEERKLEEEAEDAILNAKIETWRKRIKGSNEKGNREENLEEILTDSPTIAKSSVRLLVTLAAKNEKWSLKSSDVTRGFYLNQGDKLIELGMEVCRMDPALFFYFDDVSNILSEDRELAGVLGTHVDDSMTAGNDKFTKNQANAQEV